MMSKTEIDPRNCPSTTSGMLRKLLSFISRTSSRIVASEVSLTTRLSQSDVTPGTVTGQFDVLQALACRSLGDKLKFVGHFGSIIAGAFRVRAVREPPRFCDFPRQSGAFHPSTATDRANQPCG